MSTVEPTPAAIALGAVFLTILACSAAVWAWILSARYDGRDVLPFTPREPVRWHPLVLSLGLGWLILHIGATLATILMKVFELGAEPAAAAQVSVTGVVIHSVISLAIWATILAALRWQSPERRLADVGITFERPDIQAISGILGALASALPVLGAALTSLPFRSEETQHALLQFVRGDANVPAIAAVAFAAVVAAPLMEEILFRVVLQGWLTTVLPAKTAIGVTAVIFAAVHGWPDALPLIPLALILGVVYHRTHRYFAVVALHAAFNATNLAFAVLAAKASG